MFLIFLFSLSMLFTRPSLAVAVVVPAPTVIVLPTPTTTDEIQRIREVVQQKVKEKLRQITNPTSSKQGIIGKIIQVGESDITIEYQNTTRVVKIDDTTAFIDLNRNKTTLAKVKIGQDILALGINNSESNTFEGKRIVFIDMKTMIMPKTVVIGKIVDLSKSSPIFTLIPSKNKNNLFQIKTDTKTAITDKDQKKIGSTNLKSGQKIIAILTPDLKMSKTYYASQIIDLDYQPAISPTPTSKP
jgi:hypothetical protein